MASPPASACASDGVGSPEADTAEVSEVEASEEDISRRVRSISSRNSLASCPSVAFGAPCAVSPSVGASACSDLSSSVPSLHCPPLSLAGTLFLSLFTAPEPKISS